MMQSLMTGTNFKARFAQGTQGFSFHTIDKEILEKWTVNYHLYFSPSSNWQFPFSFSFLVILYRKRLPSAFCMLEKTNNTKKTQRITFKCRALPFWGEFRGRVSRMKFGRVSWPHELCEDQHYSCWNGFIKNIVFDLKK